MHVMDKDYCTHLADETQHLFEQASSLPTRSDILILLRSRARHWRLQLDLADRDGQKRDQ